MKRWLVLALPVLALSAQAEPARREVGLPPMTTYYADVHHGGPQTFAVAQGTDGVLYFGNLRGLVTYDGAWWRLLMLPDEQSPMSLATDAKGQVALGLVNDFGFLAVDQIGSLVFESHLKDLEPKDREFGDVSAVCGVRDGFIFITENGVLYSDRHSSRFVVVDSSDTRPRDCLVESGEILLRSRAGVSRLDPATFRVDSIGVAGNVRAMVRDGKGNLIVAIAEQGLFRQSSSTVEPFASAASAWVKKQSVSDMTRLLDGRICIASRQGGLLILGSEGEIEQIIDETSGLPDAIVNGVTVDRYGSVWIAMDGPIVRVDISAPVSVFDSRLGLKGSIGDVVRFRERLYVASSHGLYVIDKNGVALDSRVRSPWRFLNAGDELLVGTSKGVYALGDGNTAQLITAELEVYDLARSTIEPSRIWITHREGVSSLRHMEKTWRMELQSIEGVPEYVSSIAERFGVLWIGTVFDGVVRVDGPLSNRPRVTRYGRGEVNVSEVDGRLVFVRADGQIVQPSDEASKSLVPDTFLGDVRVPGDFFLVTQDGRGDVWLNSSPPHVLRRRPDGRFIHDAQALPAVNATDIQNIRVEGDHLLWFASDRGLFRYDLRAPAASTVQPAPLIRRVSTADDRVVFGGGAVAMRDSARLSPDFSRIRIEFAPVSFAPGVQYQYRLDPSEGAWSSWTNAPAIDFTSLDPGEYVFRVRARSPGTPVSAEARWQFIVLAPWYRSPFAYLLWTVLVAATIAGFIRLRTRSLRLHAEELREQVDRQTAKLQEAVAELRDSNHALAEAQEKIASFNESSGEALHDVRAWSKKTAEDLAGSIHAQRILVSIVSDGELVAVSATDIRPPRLAELESMPHKNVFATSAEGHDVVPVPGLTGRVFGALTVVGKNATWTEPERQVVSTFAHQLGGALELQQVRNDLVQARQRTAAARKEMSERGIALLQICPNCSNCYDDKETECPLDHSSLDPTRILPFRVGDRFRLVKLLGTGGMGDVFAARDERLERDVAVKVIRSGHLSGDGRSRFEREARSVARIRHPHVIAIHDSGELEDGSAFIVTELLDGCDLAWVLRRHGRGSPKQVARLLRQSAGALGAAHEAGLIHRDIKPANLFLVNDDGGFSVKLLDFGIAKAIEVDSHLTQSGTLIGTPAYMAPEQVTSGRVDRKSDLYSLAAVIYEALLGVRLSGRATGFAALWDIMSIAPLPPSELRHGIPPAVDAAILEAVAKEPEFRPDDLNQWAEKLASELEGIESSEPPWPFPLVREQNLRFVTVAAAMDPNAIASTTPIP